MPMLCKEARDIHATSHCQSLLSHLHGTRVHTASPLSCGHRSLYLIAPANRNGPRHCCANADWNHEGGGNGTANGFAPVSIPDATQQRTQDVPSAGRRQSLMALDVK